MIEINETQDVYVNQFWDRWIWINTYDFFSDFESAFEVYEYLKDDYEDIRIASGVRYIYRDTETGDEYSEYSDWQVALKRNFVEQPSSGLRWQEFGF